MNGTVDWASAVVGLGGLFVAGLGLVFTYRARTSAYQEQLYERRLDAYGGIVRTLGELHDEIQAVLPKSAAGPLDVTRLREQTREPADAFLQAYRVGRVFLTKRINEPIVAYIRTFGSLAEESAVASDARHRLDAAFERVAEAANKELGVDVLSLETSALFGDGAAWADSTPSAAAGSVIALGAYVREVFEDFDPENERHLKPGTNLEPRSGLREERSQIYADNRNIFLIHTWRPSETPGQTADISIRLEEHVRSRGATNKERPLTDALIEKVEYHVGRSWFGGGSVVKTNAEDGFRLDISAYGSTLCLARVHFKDGRDVSLHRYLDFADVRRSP